MISSIERTQAEQLQALLTQLAKKGSITDAYAKNVPMSILLGVVVSKRPNSDGSIAVVDSEHLAHTRELLDNPYYLPRVDEIYDVFGDGIHTFTGGIRLGPDWFNYVSGENGSRYEVLTQEYVSLLGTYLADRASELGGSPENPTRILEIGAGDGRLSYFLQLFLQSAVPGQVSMVATDNCWRPAYSNFSVDLADYRDALQRHKPNIVISSWMPPGEDWTKTCASLQSVQEIILIGDSTCCGTKEAWMGDSRFDSNSLPNLESVQINRTLHPQTVSQRRTRV